MANTPSRPTAVQKLERSKLDSNERQQELMGEDLDVQKLRFYLQSRLKFEAADRLVGAKALRSIEGASTMTITVNDYDRAMLRSGLLSSKLDIEIDGLWFRLRQVKKSGDNLILVFEDREIAVLRKYSKKIWAARSTTTRAEFVYRIIREIKEFRVPVEIPELRRIQPIEKAEDDLMPWESEVAKDPGIPVVPYEDEFSTRANFAREKNAMTVKGAKADKYQINMANVILRTGQNMGASRRVLVCAIMAAITESQLRNLPGGDGTSAGLFQQTPPWGSYADRTDPVTSARLFFRAIIPQEKLEPTVPRWVLIADVQRPREDLRDEYEKWATEGERFVTAFGIPGGKQESTAAAANNSAVPEGGYGEGGTYMYYRWDLSTKKGKKENSWDCIQRLAQEVNWRAFFVSGRFYFMSEDALFKQKPLATLHEFAGGVDEIDGDYDSNKKAATLSFPVRMGRWSVPPGSVVILREMGPWNGRWLVTEVERDLFSSEGNVTLKKPDPKLPEPLKNNYDDGTGWGSPEEATGNPNPLLPPPGDYGNAAEIAKTILWHSTQGHYRDDNGRQIKQLQKIAQGQKLANQGGFSVFMDSRVMQGLLYLLENGYWVGTFSLVEDHSFNQGQHPKGQAVDISSLGKPGIGWFSLGKVDRTATILTKEVMTILATLDVWDLICNGVGANDSSVQALQYDNGVQRGGIWETDHINHIHWGVGGGNSGGS